MNPTDTPKLNEAIVGLQHRIAGLIMALHRDFPNHQVTEVEVLHKEQRPGGYKYVNVLVSTKET